MIHFLQGGSTARLGSPGFGKQAKAPGPGAGLRAFQEKPAVWLRQPQLGLPSREPGPQGEAERTETFWGALFLTCFGTLATPAFEFWVGSLDFNLLGKWAGLGRFGPVWAAKKPTLRVS